MTFTFINLNKKEIKINELTIDIKQKIASNELKVKKYTKEFAKQLSADKKHLPLFDVINKKVIFYDKKDIFTLIKNYNFRQLNDKLINYLIKNKYSKEIIDTVNLFDFNILEDILLKFIYYESEEVGFDITYFENPAFNELLNIKPFLKKSVIINTGLNIGIIKVKDIENYYDDKNLKLLYEKVKHIFFTKEILLNHMDIIYKNKMNSLLSYFTLYGSYFINKYLRGNNKYHDDVIISQINQLNNLISKTPKLNESKQIFRFLHDASFMNLEKVGDIYVSESFLSCTRKPNINAMDNEFGFILLKINLSTKYSGYFLSIESDSVYPDEKEIIIKPGVKFRLKSIDDNVEFYLFNKEHLRNITKKYELEIVGITDFKMPNYEFAEVQEVNILDIKLYEDSLENKIQEFFENYCLPTKSIFLTFPNNIKKKFYFNFYKTINVYKKIFYYDINEGFFIYSFNENNEIDIFIEVGDELIVNYPSKYLKIQKNNNLKDIISLFCMIFKLSQIKIFPYNRTLINLNDNLIYDTIKFNEIIKDIIYDNYNNYEFEIYNLKKYIIFLNKIIEKNMIHPILYNFIKNKMTYKNLLKYLYENKPLYLKYIQLSLGNIILNCHLQFNPYEYLIDNNYIFNVPKYSRYKLKRANKTFDDNL